VAAHLTWRNRIYLWLARRAPRELVYWCAVRIMAEHVGQPELPRMSRVERAGYCGRLRMNYVVDEFAVRIR
jgi:hypothetical protein